MPKYYIEIPHEENKIACLRAIKILKETGSHFLTNASFGCMDGDHSARLIIDLDDKNQAMNVVPRAYRTSTKVIEMSSFSLEEIEKMLEQHSD